MVNVDNCCWYVGGVAYNEDVGDVLLLLLLVLLLLLLLLIVFILMVVDAGGSTPSSGPISAASLCAAYVDRRRTLRGVMAARWRSFSSLGLDGLGSGGGF